MAVSEILRKFLASSKIRYTVARHPVAYTAQEIAAAQHVPGRQLAKSVLVKTERGAVLAVLPAIHLIDLKKLKAALGAKQLTIAKETDIKRQFPDIEVGAMSPFGNLYGVPVIVDRDLGEAEEVVFNGGSHTETVKLRYRDFAALVHPKTGAFSLSLKKPARRKAVKTTRRSATGAKPSRRRRDGRSR